MEFQLNADEARVLGALMEKEMATPEYYPLSLHALTAACNQKSNRFPVVNYDERTVVRALEGLREKKLASAISEAGSRVPKYVQRFTETVGMDAQDAAVLCELLVRGPQTAGELRTRGQRLAPFEGVEQVEKVMEGLMAKQQFNLLVKLPRQAGCKECRYAHLLCGAPVLPDEAATAPAEPARMAVLAENERIARLESSVEALQAEMAMLKQEVQAFRKQFE